MAKQKINPKAKKALKNYEEVKKKSKPGEGKRFDALTKALESKGVENPEGLAYYIGAKKYGEEKMAKMAAKGRKKKG